MTPEPRLLGAVLAGGAARRFGSDKALAVLAGKPLIEHVIERLRPQVEALVVVGRDHFGVTSIADRPGPGQGPLGGLAAALAFAAANGFDAVATSGCDLPDLPPDLVARLGDGPAYAAGQPLLGVWPAALAGPLDDHLAGGERSLFGWVAACGARAIEIGAVANVNTTTDLAALSRAGADR